MIKINEAQFVFGTQKIGDYPDSIYPEVAFSGRSNVGKSSLINSIVHRKNLARISQTPGKTAAINFFLVEQTWCFADLPGFGYAQRSKKQRAHWHFLNYDYLEKREHLKLVCVLVDSRHDPQDADLELIEWLENHEKNYIIIMTKCDKIKQKDIEERKAQLDMLISQCSFALEVLPYSAKSGLGRAELLQVIKRECQF